MRDEIILWIYRKSLSICYRWCMANAYLTQYYAPAASTQWVTDADHWRMELWRLERGLR